MKQNGHKSPSLKGQRSFLMVAVLLKPFWNYDGPEKFLNCNAASLLQIRLQFQYHLVIEYLHKLIRCTTTNTVNCCHPLYTFSPSNSTRKITQISVVNDSPCIFIRYSNHSSGVEKPLSLKYFSITVSRMFLPCPSSILVLVA